MRQLEHEFDLQEMALKIADNQPSKLSVRPDFRFPIIAKRAIQSAELL
ncbi:hypothetical protein [Rhizobium leguminosarum]